MCKLREQEKLKLKEAEEVRSWGRYVDGEGYKIFSSDAINKIHGWMERCFILQQNNEELKEQNQVLQSLLDLKQQEISVLESKVGER